MLGLREEVCRAQGRIAVLIGDHERLRRAVQSVHAYLAEHELLGERREDTARATDHIDPGHCLGTVGHGRDGLGPANLEDTVHACYVGGHEHDRMDAPVDARIRRYDDLVHARDPRGNDGHQHR